MPSVIFRIYTEAKNQHDIIRLTGKLFESFTLQPTVGYYKGKPEKSIVIEIAGAREKAINDLAQRIGEMNGQNSVMVMRVQGRAKTTKYHLKFRSAWLLPDSSEFRLKPEINQAVPFAGACRVKGQLPPGRSLLTVRGPQLIWKPSVLNRDRQKYGLRRTSGSKR